MPPCRSRPRLSRWLALGAPRRQLRLEQLEVVPLRLGQHEERVVGGDEVPESAEGDRGDEHPPTPVPAVHYFDSFSALPSSGFAGSAGSLRTVCTEVLSTRSFTLFATSIWTSRSAMRKTLPMIPPWVTTHVALLEVGEERLVLLQLLLLRPDHEEVHDREHPGDEDEERRWASAGHLGQEDLVREHGGGLRQGLSNRRNRERARLFSKSVHRTTRCVAPRLSEQARWQPGRISLDQNAPSERPFNTGVGPRASRESSPAPRPSRGCAEPAPRTPWISRDAALACRGSRPTHCSRMRRGVGGEAVLVDRRRAPRASAPGSGGGCAAWPAAGPSSSSAAKRWRR